MKAKEGLAMINGTQLITSLGAEAVHRSRQAAICADIAVALSLEALKGTPRAYHPCIHSCPATPWAKSCCGEAAKFAHTIKSF